jgi:hypothetical protein
MFRSGQQAAARQPKVVITTANSSATPPSFEHVPPEEVNSSNPWSAFQAATASACRKRRLTGSEAALCSCTAQSHATEPTSKGAFVAIWWSRQNIDGGSRRRSSNLCHFHLFFKRDLIGASPMGTKVEFWVVN